MDWMIDKSKPICPQITEQLSARISLGILKPDEKLSSVRDVAMEAGINPNTVQKAFSELEREGLIYSRAGSGWYVSKNTEGAGRYVEEMAIEKTEQYLKEMWALGKDTEEITRLIMVISEEEKNEAARNILTGEE